LGKHALTVVANGGGIPARFAGESFLKSLQQASRFLRWLSCSLIPVLYERMRADEKKKLLPQRLAIAVMSVEVTRGRAVKRGEDVHVLRP
jgi:hypothetical protein